MTGALHNLTTPFKASAVALVAHHLIEALGLPDADAAYISEAAWMLLTAALAWALPADLGLGTVANRALGWILRLKMGAPAIVLLAGLTLGGCAAQATQDQQINRCEWAETLAASGRLAAAVALADSEDEDLKLGVAVALHAVDKALAEYCDAVRAGEDPSAERAALRALRTAVDDLTMRLLQAGPPPPPA